MKLLMYNILIRTTIKYTVKKGDDHERRQKKLKKREDHEKE
jgi:hypothetical protein